MKTAKVAKFMEDQGVERFVFRHHESSQFYGTWDILVARDELDKLEPWHVPAALEHGSTAAEDEYWDFDTQGHSMSRAMKAGLQKAAVVQSEYNHITIDLSCEEGRIEKGIL